MLAHASRIRFFCETNLLYEATPTSASTTTIPTTIQRISTSVPFRALVRALAFDRSAEAYLLRVQGAYDGRDLLPERLGGPQQVDHLGRRHAIGPAQQPVAGNLEAVALPVREEPVHHARVAQRGREPFVGPLHVEPAVELLRLELDVTEREGAREPSEQVLLADLQRRTHG